MLAIRVGNITSDGNETIISITSVLDRDGKTIKDYPKSDAGRRSLPVDDYTADTVRAWIELKSEMMRKMGLKPSMSMLVCGPEMIPRTEIGCDLRQRQGLRECALMLYDTLSPR